jgi:hypothetical protein
MSRMPVPADTVGQPNPNPHNYLTHRSFWHDDQACALCGIPFANWIGRALVVQQPRARTSFGP